MAAAASVAVVSLSSLATTPGWARDVVVARARRTSSSRVPALGRSSRRTVVDSPLRGSIAGAVGSPAACGSRGTTSPMPTAHTQRWRRPRGVFVRASETDKNEEPGEPASPSSSDAHEEGEEKKKKQEEDDAGEAAVASPTRVQGEGEPPPTAAEVASVTAGEAVRGRHQTEKTQDEEKPEPVAPFVPPPPAPSAIEGKLRATAVVREVLRLSFRDFVPVATLICVAGAAAQALNLGGTFLLALVQVHDVELIAALFLAAVQFWKLCCENACKVAVMRNARDVDVGAADRWRRAHPRAAWAAVTDAFSGCKQVLVIDARRCLSIAWNAVLTIPVPYLGLIKLLDYALCVPVFLFEGKVGGGCLKRSEELMLGSRLLLLRVGLCIAGLFSAVTGVVVGSLMVLCPTLPTLLLPPQAEPAGAAAVEAAAAAWTEGASAAVGEAAAAAAAAEMVSAATSGPTVGDAAMGIFSGSAFDRVWDVGSPAEKWATIALLTFAVAGSFAFTVVLRQLVYVFHREVAARWTPPPPPPPPEQANKDGVRGLLRKMQFWNKEKTENEDESVQISPSSSPSSSDGDGDGDGGGGGGGGETPSRPALA